MQVTEQEIKVFLKVAAGMCLSWACSLGQLGHGTSGPAEIQLGTGRLFSFSGSTQHCTRVLPVIDHCWAVSKTIKDRGKTPSLAR